MRSLIDLWHGRRPLNEAFWTWTVVWGLVVNLACTFLALGIAALDTGAGRESETGGVTPLGVLAAVTHFAAIPYNVVCLVGVWRSGARSTLPAQTVSVLRAAAVAVFVAYLVI